MTMYQNEEENRFRFQPEPQQKKLPTWLIVVFCITGVLSVIVIPMIAVLIMMPDSVGAYYIRSLFGG